jgi:hypothetical protein
LMRFSPTFSTMPHFSRAYSIRNAIVFGRPLREAIFSEWQGFSGRAKCSQLPRRVNNRFNETDIAVHNHSTITLPERFAWRNLSKAISHPVARASPVT